MLFLSCEDESCSAPTVAVTNIPAPLEGSCIISQVSHRVKKYERRGNADMFISGVDGSSQREKKEEEAK